MNKKPHSKLWLYFTAVVFATIFVVFVFISLLWLALFSLHFIDIDPHARRIPLFIFALGSLLLGTVIALYAGRLIVRPIQGISDAFGELSKGNFAVRVPEDAKLAEIREMEQRFNAMAYDLSHIETLRSDFVANVSHEFKTPLAAIEGYATLLQNPALTPEKHGHYVERILENSRRLGSLSGNILLLSKLENQERVPERTEYRIDEQIRRCILMLEPKWAEKQLEFDIFLPRKQYCGSEQLLEQVWLNLLDNAIKHSPPSGCIRIAMQTETSCLRVSIADQGDGFGAEVQKHMFEKFYQGDVSRKSEGNGLGLALVKRILELCGGSISAHSQIGQGATFVVTLPEQD